MQSQIKKVLDSSAGKELKDYLTRKYLELRDIENIQEFQTTAAQTLEVKSQRRACLKLKEILEDIMTFETEVRSKDPRDDYSVR